MTSPALTKSQPAKAGDPESGKAVLEQRIYVNGFPKSGTHLTERWVQNLAAPLTKRPWVGSFSGNAWTTEWTNLDTLPELFGEVFPGGGYLKGHCGWHPDIARSLWKGRIAVLFVYRDLRDVAVSQAFHVLDTRKGKEGGDRLIHPGKADFQALDTFEDVLVAVIEGLGQWAGLIERWEHYAGWLNEKWVYPLRFEDMVNHPQETAGLVIRYVYGMTAKYYGLKVTLNPDDYRVTVKRMVAAGQRKDTTTFRKGKTGGWRKHFTPRVKAAFMREAGDWLQRLGYEKEAVW